jgi:hypothetical protein
MLAYRFPLPLSLHTFKMKNCLELIISQLLPVPITFIYTYTLTTPAHIERNIQTRFAIIVPDHTVRTSPTLGTPQPQRTNCPVKQNTPRIQSFGRWVLACAGRGALSSAGSLGRKRVIDQRNCAVECTPRTVIACARRNCDGSVGQDVSL